MFMMKMMCHCFLPCRSQTYCIQFSFYHFVYYSEILRGNNRKVFLLHLGSYEAHDEVNHNKIEIKIVIIIK